jgi:outer membrane protein assembly factor BamB
MTPTRAILAWQRALTRIALVAAFISLLIAGLLIAHAVRIHAANPWTSPTLKALKTQITQHGKRELSDAYRRLDAEYNTRYFAARKAMAQGIPLLGGALGLCLLTGLCSLLLRRAAIDPRELPGPQPARLAMAGRYAVGVFSLLLAGTLVGLTALPPPLIPISGDQSTAASVPAPVVPANGSAPPALPDAPPGALLIAPPPPLLPPTALGPILLSPGPVKPPIIALLPPTGVTDLLSRLPKEVAQQWPAFRGPAGVGLAAVKDAPLQWEMKSGKGISWKTAIPLPGNNSPIVWGDRVFLTGADTEHREIYCFARDTGKLLWTGNTDGIDSEPLELHEGETGYAASTMATDGTRVFAIFANGDIVGYDFDGKRRWGRSLGPIESQYGYASSLTVYKELVIAQIDQATTEDGISELLALDAATGKTVWKVKSRPVPNSWSSPLIIQTKTQNELITCGNPWVIAYDPATGAELWRANCLEGDVAPSPAYGGGLLIVCKPYSALIALRPGGKGDVTKTAVAWTAEESAPDTTSPAATDELLFVTSSTMLLCLDVKTGKKLWEYDLETNVYASPIIAAGRVYVLDLQGTMHILAAARTAKSLGKIAMGEGGMATPAFVGDAIYLRTGTHIYRIGGGE